MLSLNSILILYSQNIHGLCPVCRSHFEKHMLINIYWIFIFLKHANHYDYGGKGVKTLRGYSNNRDLDPCFRGLFNKSL